MSGRWNKERLKPSLVIRQIVGKACKWPYLAVTIQELLIVIALMGLLSALTIKILVDVSGTTAKKHLLEDFGKNLESSVSRLMLKTGKDPLSSPDAFAEFLAETQSNVRVERDGDGNPKRLIYSKDQAGNENVVVYLDLEDAFGWDQPLIPGTKKHGWIAVEVKNDRNFLYVDVDGVHTVCSYLSENNLPNTPSNNPQGIPFQTYDEVIFPNLSSDRKSVV